MKFTHQNLKSLNFTNILIFILVFIFTLFNFILPIIFGLKNTEIYFALSIFSPNFPLSFFTYAFLHANFMHILFNALMLWRFGTILERILGFKKIMIFWIFSVIFIAIFCYICILIRVYLFNFLPTLTLGSSGSICAVMGLIFSANKTLLKEGFIGILLMSFLPLLWGENIAWEAHIFGFIFGVLMGFLPYFKIKNTNIFSLF